MIRKTTDQLHRLQLDFVSLLFAHTLVLMYISNMGQSVQVLIYSSFYLDLHQLLLGSIDHRLHSVESRSLNERLLSLYDDNATNHKLLDIRGSDAMLLKGGHQQRPKLLLLLLSHHGYTNFAVTFVSFFNPDWGT